MDIIEYLYEENNNLNERNVTMKIELKPRKIKEIAVGYVDNGDDGVFALDGMLTIRPPYQREFVYSTDKSRAVINTIINGFPLNIMYWAKNNAESFELLDGQQRTLSVMHFLEHKFDIEYNGHRVYIDGLPEDIYNKIMEYEFLIYECEGTDSEKMAWFEVVNIAGEKLEAQELRNSVYIGPWLLDAKKHFSKTNCVAQNISSDYITAKVNRQGLLEIALKGISEFQNIKDDKPIDKYMAMHKSDKDANELWQYFQDVISWVQKIFENYEKDMKGLKWCYLYNKYSKNTYNTKEIAELVLKLHNDEEVENNSGIYEYVLSKDYDPFAERHLKLRQFTDKQKRIAYEKQQGICTICKQHFDIDEMEGDHIIPWSRGGETKQENCQMLCKNCNSKKSNK